MSDYERNKGKLIPFKLTEEVAKKLVIDAGYRLDKEYYKSYKEQVTEDYTWFDPYLCKVGDGWYKVVWEVEAETDAPEFVDVKENEDGTIDFHSYHYNGGGHWTEVVERALK